jgi:hypothetical protein
MKGVEMAEPAPKSGKNGGLLAFSFKKRSAECAVCRLPQEARDELPVAKKKHIDRETVLEFLTQTYGFEGSAEDLTSHANGHHDQKLRDLEQA